MCPNRFLCEWRWSLYVTFDSLLPHRVSSVHENDRLSSVAVELHFKSLSRHSSPTEDREGLHYLTLCKVSFLLNTFCKFSLVFPEPSYPKADPSSTARRSWELRNFISQSKGKIKKINDEFMSWKRIDESTSMQNSLKYISIFLYLLIKFCIQYYQINIYLLHTTLLGQYFVCKKCILLCSKDALNWS